MSTRLDVRLLTAMITEGDKNWAYDALRRTVSAGGGSVIRYDELLDRTDGNVEDVSQALLDAATRNREPTGFNPIT